jgi:hypothetical protein
VVDWLGHTTNSSYLASAARLSGSNYRGILVANSLRAHNTVSFLLTISNQVHLGKAERREGRESKTLRSIELH